MHAGIDLCEEVLAGIADLEVCRVGCSQRFEGQEWAKPPHSARQVWAESAKPHRALRTILVIWVAWNNAL